ncbi:MAG: carbamoyltransferase HypF, partial [Chloroflexia bacterium]
QKRALVSPDSSTCDDCLREMLDPSNRRYNYPFINCTNCGPRFTIVQDVPYDRAYTTMSAFPMCAGCRAEYEDPLNRRFHAQPNACPLCGPHVRLLDNEGREVEVADAIEETASQLLSGKILAIKGLGGYHLSCNALDAEAVQRLRTRKHREAKPFALMVPNIETAHLLCEINSEEADLLQSRRRPIVLLKQRQDSPLQLAPAVAPDHNTLGIMLPYTPLHHLVLNALSSLKQFPAILVMTSGNRSEEPIAYKDEEARERLSRIADGMLIHNRDIHIRCDDSVARITPTGEQIFRRSRGYAPEPLSLPFESPMSLLACGGHLKNTFCLVKGKQAFLSHHIGDLENVETLASFRTGIAHYKRLFDIRPEAVAYDLHPEYLATKYALDLDLPHKIGVQHHHAHIASVIAEYRLEGKVIGIAADGTGYGTDGAIWGCEIMAADLLGFDRLSHLDYVPLPGGDQAVRQPWRMAAVYLDRIFGDEFLELDIPFVKQLDQARWRPMSQMIERRINSPQTSSLGRLFDAVSALLCIRGEALYEGQAAIEMETLAQPSDKSYAFGDNAKGTLDATPIIRAIVTDIQQGVLASEIAGRFHCTIARMLSLSCDQVRRETGLDRVALSGGVFQNRLLLGQLSSFLEKAGFHVYVNRRVPTNDGGLSFGQAAVAAAQLLSV